MPEPARIAQELAEELRHSGWCQSVGVGEEEGRPVLIVYATRKPHENERVPQVREFLPVRVQVVGQVRPA